MFSSQGGEETNPALGTSPIRPLYLSDDSYAVADPIFRQPAPVLEFTWYPGASIADPALYCLVASVRESPVKLLDATSGRVRPRYTKATLS